MKHRGPMETSDEHWMSLALAEARLHVVVGVLDERLPVHASLAQSVFAAANPRSGSARAGSSARRSAATLHTASTPARHARS